MNIEELRKEEAELHDRLRKIDNAIRAIQEVCKHDMQYLGHDSHKSWYECSKCGFKDIY